MNELRRLLDNHSADPELARLVRAARPPRTLDGGTFERSRRQVVALGSVPAALGVLVWVKHAALGAVLGATVVAAVAAPRFLAPSARTVPVPAPARAPQSTPVTSATERREPLAIVAPEPEAPRAATTAPPIVDGGLARELELLEQARAELGHRPGAALALLSQHEREFPRGTLGLEREFLVVSALVELNRRSDAAMRANALRARSPGSLYERRLEEVLGDAGGAR